MRTSKRVIRISVVIPVYNGENYLAETLTSLLDSKVVPFECLVVNDQSSDRSVQIAESFGCTVLSTGARRGPAYARNLGAQSARGDVIVFLDADVCVHPDTLEAMLPHFQNDPQLAAVFGSYDFRPRHSAFVSEFRNLLHCHIHQTGNRNASTFWTGCGAMRRDWFYRVNGFRTCYRRPSVEDIDLGYRIKAAGGRIALDPTILSTHQKRWFLGSMICSDIFDRAVPWTRLILESGNFTNDLNLRKRRRLSTLLACLGFVLPAATFAWLGKFEVSIGVSIGAIAGSVILDLDFYRFLRKERNGAYATKAVPLYLLFHLYSVLGFALGVLHHTIAKCKHTSQPAPELLSEMETEETGSLRT